MFHSTSPNYDSLNFTQLRSAPLHPVTFHSTSPNYASLHFTQLHSTPLHPITPHSTSPSYASLHFTQLHSTSPQLCFTPLHPITLHFTQLRITPLHYPLIRPNPISISYRSTSPHAALLGLGRCRRFERSRFLHLQGPRFVLGHGQPHYVGTA
jgi:hypothetical protein